MRTVERSSCACNLAVCLLVLFCGRAAAAGIRSRIADRTGMMDFAADEFCLEDACCEENCEEILGGDGFQQCIPKADKPNDKIKSCQFCSTDHPMDCAEMLPDVVEADVQWCVESGAEKCKRWAGDQCGSDDEGELEKCAKCPPTDSSLCPNHSSAPEAPQLSTENPVSMIGVGRPVASGGIFAGHGASRRKTVDPGV